MLRFWSGLAVGLVAVALLGGWTASHSQAAIGERIYNPSFEEGGALPTGWGSFAGGVARSTAYARTGNASLALSPAELDATASQIVPVSAGSTYTVTAFVRWDDSSAEDDEAVSVDIVVHWYAANDLAHPISTNVVGVSVPRSSEFQSITPAVLTAPSTAQTAGIELRARSAGGTAATVWLDDVSFVGEEPAPTQTPTATTLSSATASATPPSGSQPSATVSPSAEARSTMTPVATGTPAPAATPTVAPGWGLLRITEVMVNPAGADANPAQEWFELYNPGSLPVDLSGGTVADNVGVDSLPAITLPANGVVVIGATTAARDTWGETGVPFAPLDDGRIGNGLSNSGDRLELRDPLGRVVDIVSWGSDRTVETAPTGSIPPGQTIGRYLRSDGSLDPTIYLLPTPSPGVVTTDGTDPPVATPTPTATPSRFDIPVSGGQATFDGGRVTVVVPAGAVDSAIRLSYASRAWTDPAPGYRTVVAIELLASRIPDGSAVTQFEQDITITYRLESGQLAGVRPETLSWFSILDPAALPSTIDHSARTAELRTHLTGIFLLAGETNRAFLPVVADGWSN